MPLFKNIRANRLVPARAQHGCDSTGARLYPFRPDASQESFSWGTPVSHFGVSTIDVSANSKMDHCRHDWGTTGMSHGTTPDVPSSRYS
jgi:hypothetical protein